MKKQKFKKIRGRNKILRNIEKWKQENLFFDKGLLLNYNYLNSIPSKTLERFSFHEVSLS